MVSVMLGLTNLANPCASTLSEYGPGGNPTISYRPDASLVALRVAPVAAFVTVTCAFGTPSPCWSETVPEICTVLICASATTLKNAAQPNAIAIRSNLLNCGIASPLRQVLRNSKTSVPVNEHVSEI